MAIPQEKMQRWIAQAAILVLVLVAAYAVMLNFKVEELEQSLAQTRADAERARLAALAANKKLEDQIKALTDKSTALEQKQREADKLKALLANAELQLAPILEAAATAKAAKPEARVAALTGLGLIGQIAHGVNQEAALGTLMKALAIDKSNCVAGLALNLGAPAPMEIAPECQAILPPPPAAAEAKPGEAKPAEAKPGETKPGEAKPAAPAAGEAGKAAPPPR